MEQHRGLKFSNWGCTSESTPSHTFVPKCINDIIYIVKWAKQNNKRIRCSGYRHTWNNMFADDDCILIAMIPISQSNMSLSGPASDPLNDLLNITMIRPPLRDRKGLVKIGASVDNGTFKEWCMRNRVSIPVNVIMTENTIGGMVSTMSHGSGVNNETVSDLVYAIELIDYNGKIRRYNERNHSVQMKALRGALGLCGIIISVTFKIDMESYAIMKPVKMRKEIAIPRNIHSDEFALFENNVLTNHYNEYFWFPFSDKIWANTWKTVPCSKHPIKYPSTCESIGHNIAGTFGEFVVNNIFDIFSPETQCDIFSKMAMLSLPDNIIETHIMNALHFRHGIHNMRVRNYEIEIPIETMKEIPVLWWTAIDLVEEYRQKGKYPIRVTIEMRIMGGSNSTLMAPQSGNKYTCSIEILSTMIVPLTEWLEFVNDLISRWYAINDKCRPHWAKGWENTRVNGTPAIDKIREQYRSQIKEFNAIKKAENLDNNGMFSNALLDKIFC